MCSRVHPSDVATRRCTSRVLVTGLLERIVVYPDYWHNLAITGQRSGSENRWSYDFKARECCNSRETFSRALAFLEKVKSRPRLHLRLGRSFNVLSVFANIFSSIEERKNEKQKRERETRSLIGQDLRQTRCSACCWSAYNLSRGKNASLSGNHYHGKMKRTEKARICWESSLTQAVDWKQMLHRRTNRNSKFLVIRRVGMHEDAKNRDTRKHIWSHRQEMLESR